MCLIVRRVSNCLTFFSYSRCSLSSLLPPFTGPRYISILPVYYVLSPSQMATRIPTFSLLPAVFFARLPQIYEVPTLLHIQTKYIVYNVVRGVIERKLETRITPC